jgi:hypothetical protein
MNDRGASRNLVLLRQILVLAMALATGAYCLLVAIWPPDIVPRPTTFDPRASWVTTQATDEATGCFRFDLDLAANVRHAYVQIACNGGFEVVTNGHSTARYLLQRGTRTFQVATSAPGQRLTISKGALPLTFPREYQWSEHDNALLPTLVDLSPFLKPGLNVLCIEIESRTTTPAFILSGEVELETGQKIPLCTGPDWVGQPVPGTIPQDLWTQSQTSVREWPHVRMLAWKRRFWRLVPSQSFEDSFQGERIRSENRFPIMRFEQRVEVPGRVQEGFFRIVTDTRFQVWINDCWVRPFTSDLSPLPLGPWFIRETGRDNLETSPDLVDPGELDTLLPGELWETPRSGIEKPLAIVPPALTRERRPVEYLTYDVTRLLHPGENRISILQFQDPPEAFAKSWPSILGFDGAITTSAGRIWFASGPNTFCQPGDGKVRPEDGDIQRFSKATVDGYFRPTELPIQTYYGAATTVRPWLFVSLILFLASLLLVRLGAQASPRLRFLLSSSEPAFGAFAGWMIAGLILRAAMLDRSESVFCRSPDFMVWLFFFSLAGAVLCWWSARLRGQSANLFSSRLILRPRWIWPCLLTGGLFLCFALRAWQIDLQPPDDDEYASIQASLAIAAKGVPELAHGVWYTRSPLYHYLAGAVVALTKGDLYSLRLLSVAFACATAFFLWRWTYELTRHRWIALGGVILFSLHPYLIFVGHFARFYQQQQFFALLTVYFFNHGFVRNTGMRDRYVAVLCFLAATLSQEISLLMIIPLGVCYVLFGQRRSWPDEIRVMIAGGCALGVIAIDLAFFKIRCLTALDGASPNSEATMGWAFADPSNFFAMLIGYSRLHILLSAFFLGGLTIALKKKDIQLLSLYVFVTFGVVADNFLITTHGFRYQYALIPLWILLTITAMAECARLLVPGPGRSLTRALLACGWLVLAVLSWSPWRIVASYHEAIVGDSTRALRFVAMNLRPADRIAITKAHPPAALLEAGRADYNLAFPVLYDYMWRYKGVLIDRNAGSEVIAKVTALQRAIAKHERIWFLIDREKFRSGGKDIPWEYPSARAGLFLRENCLLAFRSCLWSVYLWDSNAGKFSNYPAGDVQSWFE